MSQFRWVQVPPSGTCLACGGSDVPRGFVDMIGETVLRRSLEDDTLVQVVDIYYCALCIEQAAQMIGSMTQEQTQQMAFDFVELQEENERLKDAVEAERQKFENLITLASAKNPEERERHDSDLMRGKSDI